MLGFLKKGVKVRSKDNYFYLGFGENLLEGEEGYVYADMGKEEGKHTIGFGASGSGKTMFLARKTYEEIRQGLQVFCIDPKGSKGWFTSFLKACEREGILYDRERGPIILALPYPEVSFKFNPLQDLTPHQIANLVANGVPPSKEAFWRDISYEITLAVALGLFARGERNITFEDIYNYISVNELEELRNRVLADVGNWGEYREQALTALDKIANYDPQFFPRVNSSLRTYLTRLITGEAGKILNVRVEKNLLKERLERGELRFFAFLNAEAMTQTAYDVARLLFAWLLTYVGYKSARLEIIKPQLRANIDEVTEIGFHEINKAIRLVRERNVSVCLMTQSPSGLMSAFKEKGKEIVSDIINSCEVRLFMKMNDPKDMEYAASFAPKVNKPRAIVHKTSVSVVYNLLPAVDPFLLQEIEKGFGVSYQDSSVFLFYSPPERDPLKVEVVWTDEPEKVKADVVVNMKKIRSNWEVKVIGRQEDDVLTVIMKEIKKNYEVKEERNYSDVEVRKFYEEFEDRIKLRRQDFLRCLDFIDSVKGKRSVVKGKNPLRNISLLDHSLRVARKAWEITEGIEITQDERELVFLASLAHDFGKAIADDKSYVTGDHPKLTEKILTSLGVSPDLVLLASRHHDKELGELTPLLQLVKKADYMARREEEKIVKEKVARDMGVKFDLSKFKKAVEKEVNTSEDYRAFTSGDEVYLEKEWVKKVIEGMVGSHLEDRDVERLTDGAFVEVAVFLGKREVHRKVYLTMKSWNPAEFQKRKRERKNLFAGFNAKILK